MTRHKEWWVELIEYPGYAISDLGRVMNTRTDLIKTTSKNQQGISMVNFSINHRQHVRSVALLVAQHFLSRDGVPIHFDTPIHLDGNKQHCSVNNLAWRPRWFAVKYHQQFSKEERQNRYGFQKYLRCVDTGEIFPNSWQAAIQYGMLDFDIFLRTLNGETVFPQNYKFEELDR